MELDPKEKRTLYQIAMDDILACIRNGEFSYDKPICTEKSLMAQYDISRITAKRAITELEGRGILYRKRKTGSFVARPQEPEVVESTRNHRQYAFVLPFDITKGGLMDTFKTANAILSEAGSGMSIHITDSGTASRGRAVLARLAAADVDGIVYYPSTNDIHLELLNPFIMENKPVVIMDIATDCPYLHGVTSDNFNGSKLLTEHLLALGHRKIAFLTGFPPESRTTIRDRFGGYLTALRQAGIAPDPDLIVTDLGLDYRIPLSGTPLSTPLCKALEKLREAGATAIETENDELAFYAILACGEMGVRIPEQLSICGFDNSESAHRVSGGITTICQNFTQIGREIAEILLESQANAGMAMRKTVVPVELLVQGSDGVPASE